MSSFIDETHLEVRSGDGGSGSVSFRREKYVPRGGPDGGDGGKGGDVVFVSRQNLATLAHIRRRVVYEAKKGEAGGSRRMRGKDGGNLVIFVPPGTRVIDLPTRKVLHDFDKESEDEEWIFLAGGCGGLGNWHFRTSGNQAPRYAQSGKPGSLREISLELLLIADVGLVGMPNAGKSSLINVLTSAKSKVADYPFTTRIPYLGVLRRGDQERIIADIPGLIEGASKGVGLGHKFLRHISRSAFLVYMSDLGAADPVRALRILKREIELFDSSLLDKPSIIIGSKADLDESGAKLDSLARAFPNDEVIGVSVFSPEKLKQLRDRLFNSQGS